MNREVPTVTATANAGSLYLPPTPALLLFHRFGTDAAACEKNWANGDTEAANITGAPTYGDAYLAASGSAGNGIDFGLTPEVEADWLYFAAHTRPSAGCGIVCNTGVNAAGDTVTSGLYGAVSGGNPFVVGRNSQQGVGGLATAALPTGMVSNTDYAITFAWGRLGDYPRVRIWENGALGPVAVGTTGGRATRAAAPAKLGLAISGQGTGLFRAALAGAVDFTHQANSWLEDWMEAAAGRIEGQLVAEGLSVV